MSAKLKARITNLFHDRATPEFSGTPRAMTAAEIANEVADLKRGGGFVAVEAFDSSGQRVSLGDIEEMAEDEALMPCEFCQKPTTISDSLPGPCGGPLHVTCAMRASLARVPRHRGMPQLVARVTTDEMRLVDRHAKAAKMSRASWIRFRSLTGGQP